MFVVIYRIKLKNQKDIEKIYKKSWQVVVKYFAKYRGAIGSRLHQSLDDKNLWVIYSCWPDKATRDASWPLPKGKIPKKVVNAINTMKKCQNKKAKKYPAIETELKKDLLFTIPNSADKRKNILIYYGDGVSHASIEEILKSLHKIIDEKYHKIEVANELYLRFMPNWERYTDLVIIPGGRSLPYYDALGTNDNQRIVNFVKNGGKFLGICAGGYYGAAHTIFEKGGKYEVLVDGPLNFYPGTAEGPAYGLGKFEYNSEKAARASEVKARGKIYTCYHNGGAFFHGAENKNQIKIIARYADIKENPAAIVQCKVGKGMAILSGVHFEYNHDASNLNRSGATSIKKKLKLTQTNKIDGVLFVNY